MQENRVGDAGVQSLLDMLEQNTKFMKMKILFRLKILPHFSIFEKMDDFACYGRKIVHFLKILLIRLEEVHLFKNPFKLSNFAPEQINDPRVKLTCMQEI